MITAPDENNKQAISPAMRVHVAPRQPSALAGQIERAEDFDILPEDVLAAMEG